MPKATLDSLWGSLEGKFNKFVAGDNVDESGEKPSDSQEAVGPYSYFGASTNPTSNVPSRSASAVDFRSASNSTASNVTLQKPVNGRQRRSSTPGVKNAHADAHAMNGYLSGTLSPAAFDGQTSVSPVPEGQSSIDNANNYGYSGQGQNMNSFSNPSIFQPSETGNSNTYQYGSNLYSQQAQPDYNTISPTGYDTGPNAMQQNKDQSTYSYYNSYENPTYTNNSDWWGSSYSATNYNQTQDQTQTNNLEGEFISPMDNKLTHFSSAPEPATSKDSNNEWNDDLGLSNNSFSKKKNVEFKEYTENDEH
ncbi:14043_t:CDS:1, partial [Acaulospora colombiana]